MRLVKQALPRLLAASAAILGAELFLRWVILPPIESLFGPGSDLTSGIRRVSVLAFLLLAYAAYVRFIEKRPVTELRPAPRAMAVGGLSGALLIGVAMAVLFAVGAYEVTVVRGFHGGLWGIAVVIALAALMEEIAFRGVLFGVLERTCGTMPALWLQSLVFALLHIGNFEDRASTQEMVTTMVSTLLLGAFWTLVYVNARNLWVVTANHAAWNFTIILSGLPLTGLDDWRGIAPLTSEYHGPIWLTGGIGGPEDAWLTLAIVLACVVGLLRWAKARDRIVVVGNEVTPIEAAN